MPNVPEKLITKDYTFEANFDATIFNYREIIQKLNEGDYNLVGVETHWSWRRPFGITIKAIVKETTDIDLVEIRHNRSQKFLEEQTGKTERGEE